jgi:hypothetical protein
VLFLPHFYPLHLSESPTLSFSAYFLRFRVPPGASVVYAPKPNWENETKLQKRKGTAAKTVDSPMFISSFLRKDYRVKVSFHLNEILRQDWLDSKLKRPPYLASMFKHFISCSECILQ